MDARESGSLGGRKRAAVMSGERRREIAMMGVEARWDDRGRAVKLLGRFRKLAEGREFDTYRVRALELLESWVASWE